MKQTIIESDPAIYIQIVSWQIDGCGHGKHDLPVDTIAPSVPMNSIYCQFQSSRSERDMANRMVEFQKQRKDSIVEETLGFWYITVKKILKNLPWT